MLNDFYKQFKSGTDIRGIASDGVEGEVLNLTNEAVKNMAGGFAMWLSHKLQKNTCDLKISIGRDSRISGERIATVVKDTLVSFGCKVIYTNYASTPSMFMTTVDLGCDGAVQITASHHPFNRNGLKFFTRQGGLEGSDITNILQYAQDEATPEINGAGTCEDINYMEQYCENLKALIKKEVNADNYDLPLEGFKIAVDAGNGVGGFYADKVLAPLGADVSGSRYLDPDGMFPNHVPNPESPVAMKAISEAVIESGSDLGVIFDTDVDRGAVVDSKGNEINRNRLVALASAIALENCEGGTIVTDSITSDGLKEFIEKTLGGKHYRYRRGYKNVIDKAIELNAQGIPCPLAIETSGHAAMQENYFLDDGAYLCTKIIIKAAKLRSEGKDISDLISTLKEAKEEKEIRIKITDPEFRACGEKVIAQLTEYAEKMEGWFVADDNREGIRVSFDKDNGDGWFLLRLSVHDPIMPLNIESNIEGGVEIIYSHLTDFFKTTEGLDI